MASAFDNAGLRVYCYPVISISARFGIEGGGPKAVSLFDGLLHMMFKLAQCAEKSWRRLRGFKQLPKVFERIHFVDGIEETATDSVVV